MEYTVIARYVDTTKLEELLKDLFPGVECRINVGGLIFAAFLF